MTIASGIVDRKLLDELLELQITPKTLVAFSLFPAVYVSWASGQVEQAERDAVLKAAHDQGIEEGSPAHQLLETWLKKKPTEELTTAWNDFIHAIRPTLSIEAFEELRESAMNRARDIAEGTGGFLASLSVSAHENNALKELDTVFVDSLQNSEI